jgi:hypothetical protein
MERIDAFHAGQRVSRFVFGRKEEEFAADFCVIAKRALEPRAWRIFQLHFLGGLEWPACTQRLGMNKGEFFTEVYRIQQRCGRAFYETRPYAIYPIYEYFGGTTCREDGAASEPNGAASEPGLRMAA